MRERQVAGLFAGLAFFVPPTCAEVQVLAWIASHHTLVIEGSSNTADADVAAHSKSSTDGMRSLGREAY